MMGVRGRDGERRRSDGVVCVAELLLHLLFVFLALLRHEHELAEEEIGGLVGGREAKLLRVLHREVEGLGEEVGRGMEERLVDRSGWRVEEVNHGDGDGFVAGGGGGGGRRRRWSGWLGLGEVALLVLAP